MDMKVHFLRGATRLLWLTLLASSLASCSVYFAKDWREVKPKFRKRYYIPEQSDKVADIRYEVFHAKTGQDLS
ncbi:MAG: retrotransposon gag domain-containing protein, partial [Schleiferiaceae bacterium]|nr:retrotransposon gag domain-containing protein [Schleiferiaceae bacterium]